MFLWLHTHLGKNSFQKLLESTCQPRALPGTWLLSLLPNPQHLLPSLPLLPERQPVPVHASAPAFPSAESVLPRYSHDPSLCSDATSPEAFRDHPPRFLYPFSLSICSFSASSMYSPWMLYLAQGRICAFNKCLLKKWIFTYFILVSIWITA